MQSQSQVKWLLPKSCLHRQTSGLCMLLDSLNKEILGTVWKEFQDCNAFRGQFWWWFPYRNTHLSGMNRPCGWRSRLHVLQYDRMHVLHHWPSDNLEHWPILSTQETVCKLSLHVHSELPGFGQAFNIRSCFIALPNAAEELNWDEERWMYSGLIPTLNTVDESALRMGREESALGVPILVQIILLSTNDFGMHFQREIKFPRFERSINVSGCFLHVQTDFSWWWVDIFVGFSMNGCRCWSHLPMQYDFNDSVAACSTFGLQRLFPSILIEAESLDIQLNAPKSISGCGWCRDQTLLPPTFFHLYRVLRLLASLTLLRPLRVVHSIIGASTLLMTHLLLVWCKYSVRNAASAWSTSVGESWNSDEASINSRCQYLLRLPLERMNWKQEFLQFWSICQHGS
jgi:hypothetical protein